MSARHGIAVLAAAGALLAGAPAAGAFWSARAGGSAAAAAASPAALVVTAGTAAAQPAFPTGSPTGGVSVSLRNPNPYRVHVGTLVLDAAAGAGGFSANAAGCDLAYTPPDGGGWDVPANGTIDLVLAGVLSLPPSAPAACARLAVDVHLEAAP
jgi:hypothetical protein